MAKKIDGYIKLQIAAGQANPSPPVGPALVKTNNICTGSFRLFGVFALCEDSNPYIFSSTVWKYGRTTDDLVALTRIHAQIHRYLKRFCELDRRQFG